MSFAIGRVGGGAGGLAGWRAGGVTGSAADTAPAA